MIEIKHLRKEFEEAIPLKDVNCVINDGDCISVIGPSGTGKSTLIRCINMLNVPTSGQIIIDGQDITDPSSKVDEIRRKVGMVFQNFNLYQHLTVIENVMLGQTQLMGRDKQEAYDNGMRILQSVGMVDQAYKYPKQLSGGQQQRAAIARTLAMEPSVILLDEPTSALDPLTVSEVESIIENLSKQGRTMMIVTHSMKLARRVSNRVFYMDEGGIYEDGTPEQIFDNPVRPNTQRFIFGLSNIDFEVTGRDFDLEGAINSVKEFGKRLHLGDNRIIRMMMATEEICSQYMEKLEQGEFMKLRVTYSEEKDIVNFVQKSNMVYDQAHLENLDPIKMSILNYCFRDNKKKAPEEMEPGLTIEIVSKL